MHHTPRSLLVSTLIATGLVGWGCQTQPQPLEPVPPPAYSSSPSMEPVMMEPVEVNPVLTPSYESPETPGGQTYTVRKGDTYWGIAARELGDGKRAMEIQQLNPGIQPGRLSVGQELTLPPQ